MGVLVYHRVERFCSYFRQVQFSLHFFIDLTNHSSATQSVCILECIPFKLVFAPPMSAIVESRIFYSYGTHLDAKITAYMYV